METATVGHYTLFISAVVLFSFLITSYFRVKAENESLKMKLITLDALYKDDMANKCMDIAHLRAQVKETTIAEPGGLLVFKAKRAPGAPPLRLYDITEAIIIADTRAAAMKLLQERTDITKDNWWILVDITEPEIIVKEVIP